jgi:hypothetical protein
LAGSTCATAIVRTPRSPHTWIVQPSAIRGTASRASAGSVSSNRSDPASSRELSARKRCASSACLMSVMSSITLIASRTRPPSSNTGVDFTRERRGSLVPGRR